MTSPAVTSVVLAAALAATFTTALLPRAEPTWDERHAGPVAVFDATLAWLRGERGGNAHPAHWDEIVHLRYVQKIRDGSSSVLSEGLRGSVHERGYHVLLASLVILTDLDPRLLVLWGPAVTSVFTAFALFALLRPHPAAPWGAAAFALVPTTTRFLGPAFLVPIGAVLPWMVAAAVLERRALERPSHAILLAAIVLWSFFVHLTGGFATLGIVLVAMTLRAWRGERRARATLAVVALLLLLAAAAVWDTLAAQFGLRVDRSVHLAIDRDAALKFGVVPLALWIVGVAYAWARPDRGPDAVRVFGAAGAAFLVLIVGTLQMDPNLYATYDRWHVPFFFVACLPVGYAAWAAGDALARRLTGTDGAAVTVTALVVLVAISSSTMDRTDVDYRHPISDAEAAALEALSTLPGTYDRFAADRYVGMYGEALTGRMWVGVPTHDLDALLDADVHVVLAADHPAAYRAAAPGVYVLDPGRLPAPAGP